MSRILLLPIGSSGDVNPFLWIGRHLQSDGHEVVIGANPHFRRAAEMAGLPFRPIGEESEYQTLIADPEIWHPTRATPLVLRYAGEFTERYFSWIESESRRSSDPLRVIAPATAFGARLARERLGLKLLTVNLQPATLLSSCEMSVIHPRLEFLNRLPRVAKRAVVAEIRRRVSREVDPGVRRACRLADAPPPAAPFRDWWQSPDGVICLFPEWFAAPQPDWPGNLRCIGFPLEDLGADIPPLPALEDFLACGSAPVLVTAGTAMQHAARFFQAALDACVRLGRRAIFLTQHPEQLPSPLPGSAAHFDYVPFSRILPRCAAIVHHGGIGTTAQALAAGIPQLVMPHAHDQPDNGSRVRRLGAGDVLPTCRSRSFEKKLYRLLNDTSLRSRCAAIATQMRSESPGQRLREALSDFLSNGCLRADGERKITPGLRPR
jgi:UDP:flavonoid glycosyltransferase YjiC (YdhE family)